MKNLTFGLTRTVEENFIDLDKMAEDVKIDRKIESSPNGYYPVIIVPTYLIGRKCLIIPVSEDDKIMSIEELSKN